MVPISPPPDESVLRIARLLARCRNRLAPPGSPQSRLVRYVLTRLRPPPDTATLLRRRFLSWDEPRARVATWDGAAPRGMVLPPCPRILVLKLDHIGDLVVAMPALRHLRAAFPDAAMTLVCGPWNTGLAAGSGLFDRVVAFDPFDPNRQIAEPGAPDRLARFAALGLGTFDLAIDLRHEPDTRPMLLAAEATRRAGFAAQAAIGGTRLDLVVPDSQGAPRAAGFAPLHAGVRLETLAAAIAATFGRRAADPPPQPAVDRYIVVAPGAGAPVKRWPLDRLAALAAELIARHDVAVTVIGGAGDKADGAALAAALPLGRVRDLTGAVPLDALPALLRGARLFVGYDSGPSHLAAALGVPTVCVFAGVSDAAVWHPVGPVVTVVAGTAGCSPCRLTHAAECPNERACLTAIDPATVRDACERLMTLRA